jgi:CTP-dependent riboflavin kinase
MIAPRASTPLGVECPDGGYVIVEGKVIQGCGHFRDRLNSPKFRAAYRKATGEDLHKGTLNVLVDRDIPIKEQRRIPGKEFDHHEDFLLEECTVNGIQAFRLRPYDPRNGSGGHGDNVLEIASSQEIPYDPREEVTIVFERSE